MSQHNKTEGQVEDTGKAVSNDMRREDVVQNLLERLYEDEIVYLVPRNYEALPREFGKDLDLLVAHRDLSAFRDLVADVMKAAGWTMVSRRADRRGLQFRCQSIKLNNAGERDVLPLDVRTYVSIETSSVQRRISGFSHKLFAEDISRRLIRPDGSCPVWVPDARDEWLLLYKQASMKSKEAYIKTLRGMAHENPSLTQWLVTATGTDVETLLFGVKTETSLVYAGRLLKARNEETKGASLLQGNMRAARIVLGGGTWLAPILYFSGPDGSGKTTSIELVTDWLITNNVDHKVYYSLKIVIRRISRQLVWLKQRKKQKAMLGGKPLDTTAAFRRVKPPSEDERDRDDGSIYWRMRKRIALIVGVIDIQIGWLLVLKDRLRGKVVLIETSPLDIFVKYHMPEFARTEATLAPTLPKPTKGFLLEAPPESIVARKAELSSVEIAEYYYRIERALSRSRMSKRYVRIDSSKGLEHMKAELIDEIERLLI